MPINGDAGIASEQKLTVGTLSTTTTYDDDEDDDDDDVDDLDEVDGCCLHFKVLHS